MIRTYVTSSNGAFCCGDIYCINHKVTYSEKLYWELISSFLIRFPENKKPRICFKYYEISEKNEPAGKAPYEDHASLFNSELLLRYKSKE